MAGSVGVSVCVALPDMLRVECRWVMACRFVSILTRHLLNAGPFTGIDVCASLIQQEADFY
jgi:hypothetical protein